MNPGLGLITDDIAYKMTIPVRYLNKSKKILGFCHELASTWTQKIRIKGLQYHKRDTVRHFSYMLTSYNDFHNLISYMCGGEPVQDTATS